MHCKRFQVRYLVLVRVRYSSLGRRRPEGVYEAGVEHNRLAYNRAILPGTSHTTTQRQFCAIQRVQR